LCSDGPAPFRGSAAESDKDRRCNPANQDRKRSCWLSQQSRFGTYFAPRFAVAIAHAARHIIREKRRHQVVRSWHDLAVQTRANDRQVTTFPVTTSTTAMSASEELLKAPGWPASGAKPQAERRRERPLRRSDLQLWNDEVRGSVGSRH
jgi:hypothetical protein